MRLKSRRRRVFIDGEEADDATVTKLVIDGVPLEEGYSLPPSPAEDEAQLQQMQRDAARRRASEGTMFRRLMLRVVADVKRRKGRGVEHTFFNRYTFEFRRVSTSGGEKVVLEMYRRGRWDFIIELWRAL